MIEERIILVEGGEAGASGEVDGVEVRLAAAEAAFDSADGVPGAGTGGGPAGAVGEVLPESVRAGRVCVPVCPSPDAFAEYVAAGSIDAVLAAGERLSGAGGRALTIEFVARGPADESTFAQAAHEVLQAVRFESQRTGVAVAIECGAGAGVTAIGELARVIDDAAAWSVGACLRVDLSREFASQLGAIDRLGGRLHVVRVAAEEGVEVEARLVDLAAALDRARFERIVILPDGLTGRAACLRRGDRR